MLFDMFKTKKKTRIIAKKLALASNKGKIEHLLIKKTISELERLKAVSELKYLGINASLKVAKQAVSSLENLKAVSELKYLGGFGRDEVAKRVVSSLENLKAISELSHLSVYGAPKAKEQAHSAFKRLKSAEGTEEKYKSPKQLTHEIKELVSTLN